MDAMETIAYVIFAFIVGYIFGSRISQPKVDDSSKEEDRADYWKRGEQCPEWEE